MRVEFVGNKAKMASEKHFGGKLDDAQMKLLVIKVIKNAKYVGVSDRANAKDILLLASFGVSITTHCSL